MNVGDSFKTNQMLGSTTINGKQAITVDTRTQDDMILVKHDEPSDKWEPVGKLEGDLNKEQLTNGYGLWKDKEVTKGHLWWKKTIREKNNQVESDEVRTFKDIANDTYLSSGGRFDPDHVLKYNDITIASASSGVTGPFGLLISSVTCEKEIYTRRIITEGDLPPV